MRGRDKFKKYYFLVKILILYYKIFPRKFRIYLFNKKRFKYGLIGMVQRYAIIKTLAINVGNNVSIHQGVYILHIENISIGDNVSIHPMTYIDCAGMVSIGNNVSIAEGTTILSSNHNFGLLDVPIKDQGMSFKKTTICDDVWIGAKATILAGRTIESGSIVAAGAVVSKDITSNTIVGGIPAKVIKERVI